mgnify:CR=1 FL=1
MEFNDVIRKRTATRKFSDRKLSQEDIEKILEAGRLAPTAKNFQPQFIYVVISEEGLEKIDKITPCRYNAQCCLLVCSDKEIAFHKDEYSTYEVDATIVATHMILEATNLNIDSTWIEAFDKNEAKSVFELNANLEPVCIINLGYKTDDCPENQMHNQRKNLNEVVKYI